MKVVYKAYNLPFEYPFTISKGTKTHQPTLIVELEYFGLKGYGEAPAISYYNIPVEKMVMDLEQKKVFIEKFSFTDPERFWHYLHHLFPNNPFLVCALDMAGWDLYGKLKRKPLYSLWGLDPANSPLTDYTIGIGSMEEMIAKVKQKNWPVYKIKVGMENDLEIIGELRKHTDAVFRVDANEGWTLEEAMDKIPVLEQLGVQLVEQPLKKEDWPGMKTLHRFSNLPLMADESCVNATDVAKCPGAFHGINIKLTKCGGITPARQMIDQARTLGLSVMLGCMNESSVGTAAIAHLSPLVDFLDADGPLLLKSDTAKGIAFDQGRLLFPVGNGLGVEVINF